MYLAIFTRAFILFYLITVCYTVGILGNFGITTLVNYSNTKVFLLLLVSKCRAVNLI